MGLVVDTSALIHVERNKGDIDKYLGGLGREPAVLPAIVYAELQVGVMMAETSDRAARRKRRLEDLVLRLPVVEFDRAIADRWAELFARLMRRGEMIPANDLAVAATALQLNFGVVIGPHGEDHYERIPGLRVARLRA